MGASDNNTVNIPPLVLGDTFYEWMQVTNNDIIGKLNEITAYSVTGGDGIGVTLNSSGLAEVGLDGTIDRDMTFAGNVTFNGDVTTINSRELTVEDFNIVLGACGDGATDDYIGNSGGGGIILTRQDGASASFLWRGMTAGLAGGYSLFGVGCSGAWTTSDYINLTGGVGIMSSNDDTFRFKSGANATGSGFMLKGLCGEGNSGATYQSASMKMGHMSTGGVGLTQGIYMDESGLVRIYDGVNKKIFTHASHGFTFGQAVRVVGTTCALAHAASKAEAEVLGIISEVPNANQYVVTTHGEIHGDWGKALAKQAGAGACGGLTAGSVYFLSGTDGASGEITTTEVGEAGKVRKPLVLGLGATAGYVLQYVGARVSAETDTAAPTVRRITIKADGDWTSASSGLCADRDSEGVYGITHNFGTSHYTATATIRGSTWGNLYMNSKGTNHCKITTFREDTGNIDTMTVEDCGLEVILAKDVT
jgi:hypothetical protein